MKAAPIAMASALKSYRLRPGARTENVTLAWDASTGATGYRLYYGSLPGTYSGYYQTASTALTVARPAGNWFYAVTAYNEAA